MGVNGKQKGNSFERKVANLLSERFKVVTGLENSFRRNIDSGSFFGGSNQQRTQTHDLSKASFGDIVCPNDFLYTIECKFYKDAPSFNLLLKQDVKQWDEWLSQAKQDSLHANKKMVVIIKYNKIEEIVILDVLPENLKEAFKYKEYYVLSLSDFLKLDDKEFFKHKLSV